MSKPSSPAVDGRDERGKFAAGNRAGRGNPHAKRVSELRAALLSAVTPKDVEKIVAAMLKKAKQGDVIAARELLDRCVGKPCQMDVLQRLEALEQAMGVEI